MNKTLVCDLVQLRPDLRANAGILLNFLSSTTGKRSIFLTFQQFTTFSIYFLYSCLTLVMPMSSMHVFYIN